MQDLNGIWDCTDGLTYEFRVVGNTLYFASKGGDYNFGFGVIDTDAQAFIMSWADGPNSGGNPNKGIAYCDASVAGTITKVKGSTNYKIGNFTKSS